MTLSTPSAPRPGSIYDTWRPAPPPPAIPRAPSPAANSRPACPTPERIMASVAQAYGIGPPSRRRDPYTVDAKQVVIALLARAGLGVTAIGRALDLHHSTVLHHKAVGLTPNQQVVIADLERELDHLAGDPTHATRADLTLSLPAAVARHPHGEEGGRAPHEN